MPSPSRSLSLSACCLLWGNWKEIIITCTICSWVVRVSSLFRLRLRLRRNAKVSSALGQEVTRAASADVVCFVVAGTRHDQVHKCMQTTCGNVEIYSQKFITCSSAPPKPPFLVPSPRLRLLKNFLKCVAGLDIFLSPSPSLFLSCPRLLSIFSIFYPYFRKQKTLKIKRINVTLLCIHKS